MLCNFKVERSQFFSSESKWAKATAGDASHEVGLRELVHSRLCTHGEKGVPSKYIQPVIISGDLVENSPDVFTPMFYVWTVFVPFWLIFVYHYLRQKDGGLESDVIDESGIPKETTSATEKDISVTTHFCQ